MNAAVKLLEKCGRSGIRLSVGADRELRIEYDGMIARWLLDEINLHRLELISLIEHKAEGAAPTFADVWKFANRFDPG